MKPYVFRVLSLILLFLLLIPATSSIKPTLQTNTLKDVIGQRLIEKVNLNWFPEGWKFKLFLGDHRYLGLTYFNVKLVVLWVRVEDTPETLAATHVHELGHIFAYQYLTTSLREKWLEIREIPRSTPWSSPTPEDSYYNFGEEDFAECLSWTFQKGAFKSTLGPTPNQAQQDLIKEWIATLP